MKLISETAGIQRLAKIRSDFADEIRQGHEYRAMPCAKCPTPGICCQDAHFVNVRITRLEAAAITRSLAELGPEKAASVHDRAIVAVDTYSLDRPEANASGTYACPLFEKGTGCLVHSTAKPLPCISHACYDDPADLPPDELLASREEQIIRLDRQVYGRTSTALPLPLAILDR